MPQSGQITPKWLHPHVETYINDNTEFQDTTSTPDEPIRGLFVFTSAKGRDNVVLDHVKPEDWIEEFGTPDFKRYGQPNLMPYNSLSTGVVQAYSMRVMPDNATYANLVILAKVKVDKTDAANPKMIVRFTAEYHNNISDKSEIGALTELMRSVDPDADGFVTYPLAAFYAQGRGDYGNNLRVRLLTSVLTDKSSDFKNYRFEVYELLNGKLSFKDVPYVGTFLPDALVSNKSTFLEDVINDIDDGSTKVNAIVFGDTWEAIYNLYKKEVDPTTVATLETFDLLNGLIKSTSSSLKGISYDFNHADYTALDNPAGVTLSGGDDGSFKYEPTDPQKTKDREDAINAMYKKAFEGKLDRAVLSKRRTPSEFILDAGYDDEVKKELVAAITTRRDAYGFVDAGIINTAAEAISWGDDMEALGDWAYSKEIHHYKTRDTFSGKVIPVTITYLYSTLLPLHLKNVGKHIPFVGEDYTTLVGHVKGSLLPAIDADDEETKEELYLRRLNYYHAIDARTFVRGTQSTSQNIFSDLSEENNVHVLLEIKRKIEARVASVAYQFSEAEERARFKEDAKRMIEPYLGVQVRSGDVDFRMTPWEEERSILHCYVELVFRTINKRGIVEIDINRRVTVAG